MYRLVVIDDEFMVIEGMKAMIARQHLDYEVVGAAYDGIEGLSLVRELQPDLVITDIRIPGLDGLSLIEAAREVCPNTTFVVISGYTEFEYARRALSLGVRGYIDKPISMEKLNQVLSRVEQEWAERAGEPFGDSREQQRVRYQTLEEKMDDSIADLTRMDLESFRKSSDAVKQGIQELYKDASDLRREMYKYLCVIGDILREERPKIDREELVSYKEMEKQKSPEEILSYADQMLAYILRFLSANQTGSGHRTIAELLEYIEQHYQEDIGLNELAERARMSTAYLSVLFKSEVGTSFIKYLTELRIKKAKSLLKQGLKVKEVSEQVGYSNYRYFCDIFKKYTGKTPHEYKESV